MKPRLLDLFCGAGGCSVGYARSGFEVVGVDSERQPRYPFRFVLNDAITVLDCLANERRLPRIPQWEGLSFESFEVIHASPPCQRYSDLSKGNGNSEDHPDFLPYVREQLRKIGKPYVIENVEGAPMENAVRLCGTAFSGLRVIRHRLFESNLRLMGTDCKIHPLLAMPHDKRRPHQAALDQKNCFVSVTGGGNSTVEVARLAMGIDWMTKRELNEAVPPAYTEYIGKQLLGKLG